MELTFLKCKCYFCHIVRGLDQDRISVNACQWELLDPSFACAPEELCGHGQIMKSLRTSFLCLWNVSFIFKELQILRKINTCIFVFSIVESIWSEYSALATHTEKI